MNQLPQIFRETYHGSTFRRQGPFYNLKLCHPTAKNQVSFQNTINIKTRLKVHRYSIQSNERQSRRRINYSTVSYDHLKDSDFYGTRGKKDQIQSYQVLLHDREKASEILGLKVASCRGFGEDYSAQLKNIEVQYKKALFQLQSQFKGQISHLKQMLSQLRRQTGDQIKSAKNQLKQFNNDLLLYCQQFKKVDENCKKIVLEMQKPLQ